MKTTATTTLKVSKVLTLSMVYALVSSCGTSEKAPAECRMDFILSNQSEAVEGYKTVSYVAPFTNCRTLATQKSSSGVSLSVSTGGGTGYGFIKSVKIDDSRTMTFAAVPSALISANWTYSLNVLPNIDNKAYAWQLPWDIQPIDFNSIIEFSYANDTEAADLPKAVSLTIKAL